MAAARKTNSQYVVKNNKGQVVRVLDWQGTTLNIIYRYDSRRIEFTSNIKDLDKNEIPYTLIDTVKKSEINSKPYKIENVGTLSLVDDISLITPSAEHSEDNIEPLLFSFKWAGGIASGLLVLVLIVSYFVKPKEEQEVRIVQIVERPTIQEEKKQVLPPVQKIQKSQPKIVKATHKKQTPRVVRTQTPRKAAKVTTKEMSLNQVGALGVLGSLNKSNQRGGLNLNNVKTSAGIGRGGSQGSGGMQTSLYGKGLISAPLGEGQKANGAGGYGTKGQGGGKAGYGTMSLVGSSGSFFQPVRSESLVEGGLDRNEIEAVIQRHIGEIRYCYERGLQQNPRLAGRVSMRFFIGNAGYVQSADITNSSLKSQLVETCITSRLKSWKFPNPRGGVVVKVNYPFVLKRVSDS